jgi:hypothetical protein
MDIELKSTFGTWRDIADVANTTVHKEGGQKEPSSIWKRKILKAEHSPIRLMSIRWKWTSIPYWVSVHFTRHKIGIEHWVRSQREDKTKVPRSSLPQDALVEHECIANFQAIINISRKRLCRRASPETQTAWRALLASVEKDNPELFSVCVPECIYRGFCPEMQSCGYSMTEDFAQELCKYTD